MKILVTVYAVLLGSVVYGIFVVVQRGEAKAGPGNFHPNAISLGVFGLIWVVFNFRIVKSIVRDRALLSEGEIAVATITSQSLAGGESRVSKITYEFRDAAGRAISGKCTDRTRTLFEEMQTTIFYDPANPDKNVALAGATYDVIDA